MLEQLRKELDERALPMHCVVLHTNYETNIYGYELEEIIKYVNMGYKYICYSYDDFDMFLTKTKEEKEILDDYKNTYAYLSTTESEELCILDSPEDYTESTIVRLIADYTVEL